MSIFVSHIAVSDNRPGFPATLTAVPGLTSSSLKPSRLTILTEFVSISHVVVWPAASTP